MQHTATYQPVASRRVSLNRVTSLVLWLMIFAGGFVLIEPSPYEVGFAALCLVLLVKGLRFPRMIILPFCLLMLWISGGVLSAAANSTTETSAILYVVISAFLAVSTVVIAALVSEAPEHNLRTIRTAYIAAALCASALGVIGYFNLIPGTWDLFTLFGRAKGPFKDPNVFGPFLIFPALVLFGDILYGSTKKILFSSVLLTVLLAGLLLSFSRGAWGHFVFSAGLMAMMLFLKSHSNKLRLRIILGGMFGLFAGAIIIAGLLSIPAVSELFLVRADLNQSYDTGESGRFANQAKGIQELLKRPFGLGPHGFADRFPEMPHNVYINAFSAYGWLGGFSYFAFVVMTWLIGFRYALFRTPWQNIHIAAFATFAGVSIEGLVIDTDHWRHFFLLAGIVWGLSAATSRSLSGKSVSG